MLTTRKNVPLLAIVLLCFCTTVQAASRYEVADRLEQFRQFFVDFQYAPDAGIPGDLLAECYGVIIMRQYKAGFVFGVKGGDGVIFLHDRMTGEWSAPGFVRTAEGSFGFQIGGQAVDAIILIMNQSGVDMLLKSRFKIGVDASAAAGPVGRDMSAKVGPGTALLAYSRSKGLFAGAAFEGGAILNHDSFNHAMYGEPVGLRDILIDQRVAVPPEADAMIRTLKSYAVRTQARPDPNITPAPSVGQTPPFPPASPAPSQERYGNEYYSQPQYQGGYQEPYQDDAARRQAMLDAEARRAADAAQAAAEAARRAAAEAEAAAARAQGGRNTW